MIRIFKFVAATLAFVILASGLSAFGASFREDAATMPKCCGPHCSMMMKTGAADARLEVQPGAPCCNISPGNTLPAPDASVPTDCVLTVPLLATTEPLASALLATKKGLRECVLPDGSSPPLAVLGVFLL